jgi:hypothetical protein
VLLASLSSPSHAAIMLSEVMYDPQNGGANREWVELFNNGQSSVDLSGWQFGKSVTDSWTSAFPAGTTLAPQKALVITPSAATLDADWGSGINRLQVSSFPALTNDPNNNPNAATLAIRNASGVIQDSFTYKDGAGWPTTSGNDGNSIYVLPQDLTTNGNDSGSSWRPSSQGVYGAVWKSAGGDSENHASPGYVATTVQAPFEPSPDVAWSMVYLPDVQNYNSSDGNQERELGQMNWILDNKDAFKIQAVIQGGDIVNQNQSDTQWSRAKEAFHMLDGQVPYVLAAGNHDFGTTNFQNRNTQYNDYFKITDNPLNNPATGGIIQGTFAPNELENSYSAFTAPDGRQMLIFNIEYYPRQAVLDWADSIAGQPRYAEYTAVLLTHAFIGSGNTRWNVAPGDYPVEGNDGVDMWNELVKVNGNFEMTFNGHFGGDGTGYRVDANNAGVDVHQMFLDTQWETNGGNGWMRVVEFLNDGKTVRVRTYSPHFDLYRTNAASSFEFEITPVEGFLVWNTSSAAFSSGFARDNASLGVSAYPVDPFGFSGRENLLLGNNGNASLTGSGTDVAGSLVVGTNQAASHIAGRNGNGVLTVSSSKNLTLSSSSSTGDLTLGEGGFSGTLNWNSAGTLNVEGKLRVGQGGVGLLNQNDGTVIGGNTDGTFKFVGVGINSGSNGTYNINNGVFLPGGGIPGSHDRQVIIGDAGGVGRLNIGDATGGADTARVETDDDVILGRNGGNGQITVKADGRFKMAGNGAALTIGSGTSGFASVIQTGGGVAIDGELQIGGSAGATGSYKISAGTLTSAADGGSELVIGKAGGHGTLRVEGTAVVEHKAEAYLGDLSNSGSIGRLEIAGSAASVSFGQLQNVAGVSETMRWEADAGGVTPLVITGGGGPLASNRVQLESPAEVAANRGAGATLKGDGIALELNLSALTNNMTLLLIDNQTPDPITGFFENPAISNDLYEEGASIFGTGFNGTVTISYVGGTGNDVVLSLIAAPNADFNQDGVVNGQDFLAWQRNGGLNSGGSRASGDANGDGTVNAMDLAIWKSQFGTSPQSVTSANVPEPSGSLMLAMVFALTRLKRTAQEAGRIAR